MRKESIEKVVVIITVISTITILINEMFNFILPMLLSHIFQPDSSESGSLGIIGGADGPTAIFISHQPPLHLVTIIAAMITIAGISYQFIEKKRNN